MSIIEAIILGLVQGLTEFIPVSSSGHLVLLHELFGGSDYTLAFDVALHVGTLMALIVYFRNDVRGLIVNVHKDTPRGRLARLLVVATLPAVLAGLIFGDFIDQHVRSPLVVASTLALVGVFMLIVDRRPSGTSEKEVTRRQGIMIGIAQVFALIPGVSRSGITMTVGMFLGLGRVQAARFSFLLAMPIITGSAVGTFLDDPSSWSFDLTLTLGVMTAFLSGLAAIKFLLGIIAKVGLRYFAYYRIVLAAIVVLLSLL